MLKTKEEIENWLEQHYIYNYTINDDFTVNVHEDVCLNKNTPNILVQFNTIEGNFVCSSIGLQSLKGSPKVVKGSFICEGNPLTSLKYGPIEVHRDFSCNYTQIQDLQFSPKKVGRHFSCYSCELRSFWGCPKKIFGNFYCSENHIKSFQYLPKSIKGSFAGHTNQFDSFKHFPKHVGQSILLNNNLLTVEMLVDFNSTFDDIKCDFASDKNEFLLLSNMIKVKQEKEILDNSILKNSDNKPKKRL